MARAKKEGIARTFYLKKDVSEAMDKYSAKTGIPKTTIVEQAVEEYMQKRVKIVASGNTVMQKRS